GDAFDRHVVVGRADAAGGEDDLVVDVELGDRCRDLVELVGNREDATDRHAEGAQLAREERRVGVDDLTGEDLVAEDQDARGAVPARHTEMASLRKSLAPMRTLTSAGLPAPSARSRAGRICSGRSTHSPWPPRASIMRS